MQQIKWGGLNLVVWLCLAHAAVWGDDQWTNVLDENHGLKAVTKTNDLWLDVVRKAVVLDGEICLREGQLEMFACPIRTKEHESVVAVTAKPRFAHAALLAIGAKTGTPVQFDPEYKPATGMIVDVYVVWKDEEGKKHQVRAQDWIRHVKTGKPMTFDFIFSGSGFWKDDDGTENYYADAGEFVCVSNFASAMLDLPVESSQANAGLMFDALTDKIPPRKTKVKLVLVPRLEKAKEEAKSETKPASKPEAK
jgi:hypothetical protein